MGEKTILFIILILFSSCGLELTKVDLNLENGFVPEVAVSSYLVPDSLVRLKLVMTRAAYSTKNTVATLKSASVERVNDNQVFLLLQKSIGNYIELSSNELIPEVGGIYKLHLETLDPSSVLESIDTIPSVTAIIDAEILPVEKSSNQLGRIKFKSNSNSIGQLFMNLLFLFVTNLVSNLQIYFIKPHLPQMIR